MFCAHGAHAHAGHLDQAVTRRRPVDTVRVLLDAGAPVDEPDEEGITPLRRAIRWGLREIAELLVARGADATQVTAADRALGAVVAGAGGAAEAASAAAAAAAAELDTMLDIAVCSGDLVATRRLLDAGASLDAGPHDEGPPLGQACWRGQAEIARELVARGASLTFNDGGSAVGATLHGSRHCHQAEGGPTMQTIDEIDTAPYVEILRILFAAGAPFPETLADGTKTVTMFAELGIDPPDGP
jgi:hypothetical protein